MKKSVFIVVIMVAPLIVIAIGYVLYLKTQKHEAVSRDEPKELQENISYDKPFVSPVPHPGKILIRSLSDGRTKETNAEEAPIDSKFIFYKDQKEVSYKDDFDTVVPIVEVELTKDFEVRQYGEGHKLLRTALLKKGANSPDPALQPPE